MYIEALEKRILGQTLERVRIVSPFLLRTAVPPLESPEGKRVVGLRRMGKRICIGLEGDLWLVLHLMIAGRLRVPTSLKDLPASRLRLAGAVFPILVYEAE